MRFLLNRNGRVSFDAALLVGDDAGFFWRALRLPEPDERLTAPRQVHEPRYVVDRVRLQHLAPKPARLDAQSAWWRGRLNLAFHFFARLRRRIGTRDRRIGPRGRSRTSIRSDRSKSFESRSSILSSRCATSISSAVVVFGASGFLVVVIISLTLLRPRNDRDVASGAPFYACDTAIAVVIIFCQIENLDTPLHYESK